MRNVVRLVALLTLTLTTGCALVQQAVSPPELSLREVRLVEAGLREQRYQVTLDAYNPNRFSIGLEAVDWQLSLAGHDFAAGRMATPGTLPAREHVPLELSVQTDLVNYARQAFSRLLAGGDSLEYRLTGEARVESPVSRVVPFEESGHIEIRR